MSQSTVARILFVYFIVVWTAALVRFDRFPLTWVPMYSRYTPKSIFSVRILDNEQATRGMFVTHHDGSTSYLTKEKLNITKRHFKRLYRGWLFNPDPKMNQRLFRSLNKTLGHTPSDPEFIVRVQARLEKKHYRKEDLSTSWQTVQSASLEWQDAWQEQ